jgi:xylulokinase
MSAGSGPDRYVLAIDHGTSGVKVALISTRGEATGFAFEKTPIHFLSGGGAEQDPEDWWNALVAASRRVLASAPVPREAVAAVCVSSTFSSTVAVDAAGRALANSLTWMDSRGARYVRAVMRGFPSIEGYGLANLLRWVPRTAGGPTLSGKDDIAHVLLWREEFPDVYANAAAFLPSKDYLNLRLTGRCAASFDSIQLFWVTDTRDVRRIRYDDALIARLGIDRAKLPELLPSTAVLGTLTPGTADALGLPRGVKVVCGSPDHQSAGIGSGAVRDFEGHVYIGTSSWVQCVVPFKKTDLFHSIASLPTAIPGRYYSANEQDLAGGCLSFLAERVLFARELGTQPPADPYRVFDEAAARSPAGAGGVLFTPWLNGERSPVDDNRLRGGFHNLSKTTSADDLVRAVFEGVALNTRWNLKYVERFIGRRMDPLTFVGGGAKSDVWCRIFADVLDRRVRQAEEPMLANARGAAFIALVGLGELRFEDVSERVRYRRVYDPDPANRRLYDERFREFVWIYKANRSFFHRLNG